MAKEKKVNPIWAILITILTVAVLFCIVTLIVASIHGNNFTTEIKSWFDTTETASKLINLK